MEGGLLAAGSTRTTACLARNRMTECAGAGRVASLAGMGYIPSFCRIAIDQQSKIDKPPLAPPPLAAVVVFRYPAAMPSRSNAYDAARSRSSVASLACWSR